MKVLSIGEVPSFHSVHDSYIPFSIRWDTPNCEIPFYYSLRDRDRVVEIGVDPISLVVCKLVVVNIVWLDDIVANFEGVDLEVWLPILERSGTWNERDYYHIIEGEFRISYVDPSLVISFAIENLELSRILIAGPVRFGLDSEGNLAGIQVELPGARSMLL